MKENLQMFDRISRRRVDKKLRQGILLPETNSEKDLLEKGILTPATDFESGILEHGISTYFKAVESTRDKHIHLYALVIKKLSTLKEEIFFRVGDDKPFYFSAEVKEEDIAPSLYNLAPGKRLDILVRDYNYHEAIDILKERIPIERNKDKTHKFEPELRLENGMYTIDVIVQAEMSLPYVTTIQEMAGEQKVNFINNETGYEANSKDMLSMILLDANNGTQLRIQAQENNKNKELIKNIASYITS